MGRPAPETAPAAEAGSKRERMRAGLDAEVVAVGFGLVARERSSSAVRTRWTDDFVDHRELRAFSLNDSAPVVVRHDPRSAWLDDIAGAARRDA